MEEEEETVISYFKKDQPPTYLHILFKKNPDILHTATIIIKKITSRLTTEAQTIDLAFVRAVMRLCFSHQ